MANKSVQGLDQLKVKLAELRDPQALRAWVAAAAHALLGHVKAYPPAKRLKRSGVYGQAFQSDRQRRWIFAALKRGEIPYFRGQNPRSENLGQSWTVAMRSNTAAVIGTQASYARRVKDKPLQTRFMRAIGWRSVQQDATDHAGEVRDIIGAGIEQIINR